MNIIDCFKIFKLVLNNSKESAVGAWLVKNAKTLSIAESCTGGLLSSLMTDVSGSSAYIKANFVTYANEAKEQYLNVKPETLTQYGAVSVQTAEEMVRGLLKNTGSDYALATTGIAGPTGGTKEKPVGLVYIGVGKADSVKVIKYNVNHKYPRLLIKYMFAKKAVACLNEFLYEKKEVE